MLRIRELYELWRRDNFLKQALDESYLMLETTQRMFEQSVQSLRQSDVGEISVDVYEMDKTVNAYLQDVRRKVFKHLAVTGGANIIPGLVLTSIVIDAERIGDYTKNIMDLATVHPKKLQCGSHEKTVQQIEVEVQAIFRRIVPCLRASDKDAAHDILSKYWVTQSCEKIVEMLIKEHTTSISTGDAVAIALYVRHLKRVAAHLLNIASSVVNPFERVGFPEEGS